MSTKGWDLLYLALSEDYMSNYTHRENERKKYEYVYAPSIGINVGTDTNTNTNTNTDTDTNTNTVAKVIYDTDSDTESDSDTDTDTEPDPDTNPNPDSDIIRTINDFLTHIEHRVISSPQAFDTFISFVSAFTKYSDTNLITKCMLYIGCTTHYPIGKFMLEKIKYTDKMLIEPIGKYQTSVLQVISSSSNSQLFECFVTNVPNYMSLLVTPSQTSVGLPPLFHINTLQKIQYLVKTNNLTEQILKNTLYNGQNYFHHIVINNNYEIFKYLMGLDICTRDVIVECDVWETFIIETYLHCRVSMFELLVESNKLMIEDFERTYKGVPIYHNFLDNFMNNYSLHCCTIDIFLRSQYCTVSHVEKYFDQYTCLHKNTYATNSMEHVFTHEKFACLKNKYIKTVQCDNPISGNSITTLNPISNDVLKDILFEISQLKKDICELKKSR